LFVEARVGERFRVTTGRIALIGSIMIGDYRLVEQLTGRVVDV
jgi:hypothetical protein